jgi:L-asparagine transporter-like permease
MNEAEIFKLLVTQGPFAVLFVWLLFYVMKTNKEREQQSAEREAKYQALLVKITDEVIVDLKDIKAHINGR